MTFLNQKQKGYTLLFAIIVANLVLGVAAFILNITRKQFLLSSANHDSLYALYAADSGIECATETNNLDDLGNPVGKPATGNTISCGGMTQNVTWVHDAGGTSSNVGTSSFDFFTGSGNSSDNTTTRTQSGAASCVHVDVAHWIGDVNGTPTELTSVDARGYNIGWNTSTNTCDYSGPRRVERGLKYITG